MDKFIIVIFIIALLGNMVLDMRVIHSNKERIKITKEQLVMYREVMVKLDHNTKVRQERLKELKEHKRKIESVNRKLTILNKANYKKY